MTKELLLCSFCGGEASLDIRNTRSLEAAKQVLKEHGLVAVPEEPTVKLLEAMTDDLYYFR